MRRLGAGGMGAVYEAIQLDLERAVAVKVVTDASIDSKSIGRVRQEAIAAARLEHPNVVAVIDFGTDEEGRPFIVMEQLLGESLRDVIVREHRLSVARAVHIARQMLDALGAAHAAGIVHRDVKPANVMLLEDDRVKLVDFGIARLADHERDVRTTTGTLLGTPAYLAPEQITFDEVDGRADLHAVGLCLFEMLVGARPWRGSIGDVAIAVLRETPPRIDSRRGDVPSALADVAARSLAKKSAERYANAAEMSEALARSIARAEVEPTPHPPRRRTGLVIGIAIGGASLLLVLLFAVAGLVRRRSSAPAPAPVAAAEAGVDAAPVAVVSTAAPLAEPSDAEAPTDDASTSRQRIAREPPGTTDVLCAEPGKSVHQGMLCERKMPYCVCTGTVEGAFSCGVPWTTADCPTADVQVPHKTTAGEACAIHYYWPLTGRTAPGTGETWCRYCTLGPWRSHVRRGVPGTRCTGFSTGGVRSEGKWVKYEP